MIDTRKHNINDYLRKYLKTLAEAKTNIEKARIIDKIYTDGFEDGSNEGKS